MKYTIKNEKGLTLIEVLLSITLLSIILVSIMYIFPQMGFMNQKNEEKIQAINTAKQISIDWQKNHPDIKDFLSNSTLHPMPNYLIEQDEHYYTETTKDNIKVTIKITKNADLEPDSEITNNDNLELKLTKLHQIHVQLWDKNNNLIGESFGYIIVEV